MVHYTKTRQTLRPINYQIKITEEKSIAAIVNVSSSRWTAQVPEFHIKNHKEQEH